jgi:hypothetical protein
MFPAVGHRAGAQTHPTRPARIIVGFAADGLSDILARLLGQWLSVRRVFRRLRTDAALLVISPPRPVVRLAADGYTLMKN